MPAGRSRPFKIRYRAPIDGVWSRWIRYAHKDARDVRAGRLRRRGFEVETEDTVA